MAKRGSKFLPCQQQGWEWQWWSVSSSVKPVGGEHSISKTPEQIAMHFAVGTLQGSFFPHNKPPTAPCLTLKIWKLVIYH